MLQPIQVNLFSITSNANSEFLIAYADRHLLHAGIANSNPVPTLAG